MMSSPTSIGLSQPISANSVDHCNTEGSLEQESPPSEQESVSLNAIKTTTLILDGPVIKTPSSSSTIVETQSAPDSSSDTSSDEVTVPISPNTVNLLQSRFITSSEREALASITEMELRNVSEHYMESIALRDAAIEDTLLSETTLESEEKDASVTHPLQLLQRKDFSAGLAG